MWAHIKDHPLVVTFVGVLTFGAALWPIFSKDTVPEFLAKRGWGVTMPSWYYVLVIVVGCAVVALQIALIRAARISKKEATKKDEEIPRLNELLRKVAHPSSWVQITTLTNTELQQQTLNTVQQIRDFLEQRRKEEHQRDIFPTFPRDASEEAKRLLWHQYTQETFLSSIRLMSDYKKQFMINTILLRDELRKRLPDVRKETDPSPIERHIESMYENPVGSFGIEHVANELERLAKILPPEGNT
jgi:hypothetical protein